MTDRKDPVRHRIVVGVDDSDCSRRALDWAVRQAEVDGATVDAWTAWEYPLFHGSTGWCLPDAELASAAERVLHNAVAQTVEPGTGVDVHTSVAYGTPAQVLLEAARGAELLVVGNRGHGGFAGALLGSVGQHCVLHAPCPVVVVRQDG